MPVEHIRIDRRFQGPPRSVNGGYACGCIARHLAGTVAVRLKAPPPLDTNLRLETDDGRAQLFHGDTLVGEARTADLDLPIPKPPSLEEAERSSASFLGFKKHQFPGCFVCGTQRAPGDGLRIFPGAMPESRSIAAPWTPDQSLRGPSASIQREYLWSALDCPSGFVLEPVPEGVGIVLGELCATIVGDVMPGEACVVVAWPLGVDGRKRASGSAIYAANGNLIAKARALWIDIPLSKWQ